MATLTAYVNTNGNDTTGQFNNPAFPFKTIDGVIASYRNFPGQTDLSILVVEPSSYPPGTTVGSVNLLNISGNVTISPMNSALQNNLVPLSGVVALNNGTLTLNNVFIHYQSANGTPAITATSQIGFNNTTLINNSTISTTSRSFILASRANVTCNSCTFIANYSLTAPISTTQPFKWFEGSTINLNQCNITIDFTRGNPDNIIINSTGTYDRNTFNITQAAGSLTFATFRGNNTELLNLTNNTVHFTNTNNVSSYVLLARFGLAGTFSVDNLVHTEVNFPANHIVIIGNPTIMGAGVIPPVTQFLPSPEQFPQAPQAPLFPQAPQTPPNNFFPQTNLGLQLTPPRVILAASGAPVALKQKLQTKMVGSNKEEKIHLNNNDKFLICDTSMKSFELILPNKGDDYHILKFTPNSTKSIYVKYKNNKTCIILEPTVLPTNLPRSKNTMQILIHEPILLKYKNRNGHTFVKGKLLDTLSKNKNNKN